MSIATAVNRFTSFMVALTWLSICKSVSTPGCYAIFACLNVVGVWFCASYVPETMGLTLEQAPPHHTQNPLKTLTQTCCSDHDGDADTGDTGADDSYSGSGHWGGWW